MLRGNLDLVAELQVVGAVDLDHIGARAALQPRVISGRDVDLAAVARQASLRHEAGAKHAEVAHACAVDDVHAPVDEMVHRGIRQVHPMSGILRQLRDRQPLVRQLGSRDASGGAQGQAREHAPWWQDPAAAALIHEALRQPRLDAR